MICLLLSHAHYSIDLVGGLMVAYLTKHLIERYRDRFLASPGFAVAERLVEGEILYREGAKDAGIAALYEAAVLEDGLRYDEPPDWIQPIRHALGATLMQEGRFSEAAKVYREDLERLPGNGWSLFGLARALRLAGEHEEAELVEARFDEAWAGADIALRSSCFCQPGV